MLLTNGLWELIDPLSGLSSLFPVFWCFEEQLAISSCECFLVVVFVQITLFEQSWPCPFVHFFAGLLPCDCFLVFLLLFISPCLNSPGLAEQLESEAKEGCEAREPNTKTNLGISDFYKWRIAWKIWYKTTRPNWKKHIFLWWKQFDSRWPVTNVKWVTSKTTSQLPCLVQVLPP